VTGANTGIGFEAARALSSAGARVIFACRNEEAGLNAVDRVRTQHPNAIAEFERLDLASLASVREFADRFADQPIDVLVCNAGVVNSEYAEVENGFEHTVGVSHLGHFLLTQLLLPSLLVGDGGRVVMVSSESHRQPKTLNFEKLPLSRETFSIMESYGQAKLCNLLFSNELHRRYFDQKLSAVALHPGNLVTTDIGRGSFWMRLGMRLASPFTKSPNQGAATTVLCAVHPDASEVSGRYFSHCREARASREAEDPAVAERLWKLSEDWCAR
jgi:WW domain-containing oxidoreductase